MRLPAIGLHWAGLFWIGLSLVACTQSRYEAAPCGKSPLPHPELLLTSGALRTLTFYRSTSGRSVAEPSLEIWADKKFDFDTALTYRYELSGGHDDPCLVSAALQLRVPATGGARELGLEYLARMGDHLGVDLGGLAQELAANRERGLYSPTVYHFDAVVADVNMVNHPIRGDFLILSIYLANYYRGRDTTFVSPSG